MLLDDETDLRPRSAQITRVAPALYPAALFLSALLLFAIQPMFTKMMLPRIGGAAAVWSVAMVFFQAALLLGYAYAHLLSRTLSPAPSALVHLGLLAVAATTLPIGIAQGFEAAPQGGLELWLLALFAASIGLPFVALAANAPLLQNWLAASGHPHAANPPLCRVQSWVVRSPDDLPVRCRAAVHAAHTDSSVVGRLWGFDFAHCGGGVVRPQRGQTFDGDGRL